MGSRIFSRGSSLLALAAILTLSLVAGLRFPHTSAQTPSNRPVLFSEPQSTRAIAVESVAKTREPFSTVARVSFAADNKTRIMLFAGNLVLAPNEGSNAVTADAEDAAHNIYPLTVEHVGPVPNQSWATAVVVKLHQDMGDLG